MFLQLVKMDLSRPNRKLRYYTGKRLTDFNYIKTNNILRSLDVILMAMESP